MLKKKSKLVASLRNPLTLRVVYRKPIWHNTRRTEGGLGHHWLFLHGSLEIVGLRKEPDRLLRVVRCDRLVVVELIIYSLACDKGEVDQGTDTKQSTFPRACVRGSFPDQGSHGNP
jgi:hypothetical protein